MNQIISDLYVITLSINPARECNSPHYVNILLMYIDREAYNSGDIRMITNKGPHERFMPYVKR